MAADHAGTIHLDEGARGILQGEAQVVHHRHGVDRAIGEAADRTGRIGGVADLVPIDEGMALVDADDRGIGTAFGSTPSMVAARESVLDRVCTDAASSPSADRSIGGAVVSWNGSGR